jgi:hypothetical protein
MHRKQSRKRKPVTMYKLRRRPLLLPTLIQVSFYILIINPDTARHSAVTPVTVDPNLTRSVVELDGIEAEDLLLADFLLFVNDNHIFIKLIIVCAKFAYQLIVFS